MKTFFQSDKPTALEQRALERIEEIVKCYGGDEKLRYAARDAMIWFSSQPELQVRTYNKKN